MISMRTEHPGPRPHAMIHVLTVHWKDDRWIDVQQGYLRRHMGQPYRVYAFLNHMPADHRSKFFYSSTEDIRSHAVKLNLLADIEAALGATGPEDWLVFIDGDAFPIADVVPYGRAKLRDYPLVAVQRKENLGDIQPHPAFCLTTAGFWKQIGGDWKEGYEWENACGRVTDVGGNLLGQLSRTATPWLPMLRSNHYDLHPLWFALYDDLVYHHGAGFRDPFSRLDCHIHDIVPKSFGRRVLRAILGRVSRRYDVVSKVRAQNQLLSEEVYQTILKDPDFFRRFQVPEGTPGRPTRVRSARWRRSRCTPRSRKPRPIMKRPFDTLAWAWRQLQYKAQSLPGRRVGLLAASARVAPGDRAPLLHRLWRSHIAGRRNPAAPIPVHPRAEDRRRVGPAEPF